MKSYRIRLFLLLKVAFCLIWFFIALSAARDDDGGCTDDDNDDDDDGNDDAATPCCPAGTFLDTLTGVCKPCSPGCATCSGIDKCKKCVTGLVAQLQVFGSLFVKCSCTNSALYFSPIALTCQSCNIVFLNCVACTVTLIGAKCQTCTIGYFYSITTAQCTPCPSAHYPSSSKTQCLACPSGCASCSSPTSCTRCVKSYHIPSGGTCVFPPCQLAISRCSTCSDSGTSVVCDSCATGYYLQIVAPSNRCVICHFACTDCGPTGCLTCRSGYLLSSSTCVSCQNALSQPGCNQCTSSACTGCSTSIGYIFDSGTGLCTSSGVVCTSTQILVGTLCKACSSAYDLQCQTCDETGCLSCFTGYLYDSVSKVCNSTCASDQVYSGGSCQLCSSKYGLQCLSCNSIACISCATGYFFNSTVSACEIICASDQVAISGVCQLCPSLYSPQCITCTSIQCNSCSTGYAYSTLSKTCEVRPVCGDGVWAENLEACEDGNTKNFDGCDSSCQVEKDYGCLWADRLASGQSFCKFTGSFSFKWKGIAKDQSSNKARALFIIEPPTFRQWTTPQLRKLMSPITIFDNQTGTSKVIPSNSLDFALKQSNDQNELELTIDYGGSSIQNSYLDFTIDPSATNIPSIQELPSQPKNLFKLASLNNAVDLYSYSDEIYQLQNTVTAVSAFLGYLAMIFAFLGLLCPVGKLIVIEALVVIQLSFFSILQFSKIPPTFIGFKNLILSSGYNDLNLLGMPIAQKDQTVFTLMGLDQSLLANYNFSFVLFFCIPMVIGLIGTVIFTISKRYFNKPMTIQQMILEKQKDKNASFNSEKRQLGHNIKLSIFRRILFQFAFYGLVLNGFLAWVSIFQGLRNGNLLNILIATFFILAWVVFGFLFMKLETQRTDLSVSSSVNLKNLAKENQIILGSFGEFKNIKQQFFKNKPTDAYQKDGKAGFIYIVFMLQIILISSAIVYLSSQGYYSCIFIIGIYGLNLIALFAIRKLIQKSNDQNKQISLCSSILRNYALRQSFNFITIIIVEIIILLVKVKAEAQGDPSSVFASSQAISKIVPMVILCLLALNLIANILLWLWQIKCNQLIEKTKAIKRILSKSSLSLTERHKNEQISDRKILDEDFKTKGEIDKIFDTLVVRAQKNSPFIGVSENSVSKKLKVDGRLDNRQVKKRKAQNWLKDI